MSAGAIGGFVGGAITTGSLSGAIKGAVLGGLTGAFAYGIGDAGQYMGKLYGAGANFGTRIVLHGGLSSFMSKAQGGRWSSGFWSGAVGTSLAPLAETGDYYGNVASNAIIGGTLSSVTGGKFANGAALGAFRYMFNDALHEETKNQKMWRERNEGLWSGIKKGSIDIYQGIVGIPKAFLAYYDNLISATGYKDWVYGNKLPLYRWEAKVESKVFWYGIENHFGFVMQELGNDFLNRPNYYLSGLLVAPAIGTFSEVGSAAFTSASIIKVDGAIDDVIHTEINPLH
jgi:hypothetical protein